MMLTSSIDGKQKPSRPRSWGCLKLLLIPLIVVVAGYGGMWLFARYGGDWAISDQFPVPPESQTITASFIDAFFMVKITVYFHSWTPEELHTWFEQADILFLPKCGKTPVPEGETCYEFGARYTGRQLKQRETLRLALYRASIGLTVSPTVWNEMGWDNAQATCASIAIYGNQEHEAFSKIYPGLEIPQGHTAFVTTNCWPKDVTAALVSRLDHRI